MTAQPKKIEADTRMKIWDAVCKTDPKHTKRVNQRGGFTAIDAQYQIMEATRQFGPVGEGWGYTVDGFQIVDSLIVVPVTLWHGSRDNVFGPILGCAEMLGQRPDRDAPKKAITDAITKGLSQLGFNADVFLGLFDDNKYVEKVTAEFASEGNGKLAGISKIKARLNKLMLDGDKATDLEAFNALVHDCKDELTKVRDANHQYWAGDGEDFEGFKNWIVRRREELTPVEGSVALQFLLSLLAECQRQSEVQNIAAKHGEAIDALEDAERRLFEQKFDEREAALAQLDRVTEGA